MKSSSDGDGKLDTDLDGILTELGELGRYQIRNYVYLVVLVVFTSCANLSYVFTARELEYRCFIPECEGFPDRGISNDFMPEWIHNAVPIDEYGDPAKCECFQYVTHADYLYDGRKNSQLSQCDARAFNKSMILTCDQLLFKTAEVNIVNEFNITCDGQEWPLALIGSLGYIAELLACPVVAIISDRYGRRTVLAILVLLSGLCGLVKSFSIDYTMFAAMEFVTSLVSSNVYVTLYVMAIENAGPTKRVFSGSLLMSCYALSQVLTGIVAMFVPYFRTLLQILYAPVLAMLLIIWLIPESVRWLVSTGKMHRARTVLMRAAEVNRIDLSVEACKFLNGNTTNSQNNHVEFNSLNSISESVVSPDTTKSSALNKINLYSSFFRSRILCRRFLTALFCWFFIKFIYFGMTIQSVVLGGNVYVNYALVNIVEIPAIVVYTYLIHWIGGRRTICFSLIITGAACICTEFIPEQLQILRLFLYILGKCGVTIAFSTLYMVTSDMWPTPIRHSMVNACTVIGTMGSVIAPFTSLLRSMWSGLPLICFAGSAFVTGLMVLLLPETANLKLPDTVAEAELLGKQVKPQK